MSKKFKVLSVNELQGIDGGDYPMRQVREVIVKVCRKIFG